MSNTLTWDNLQLEIDNYFKNYTMNTFVDDGYPLGAQFDPKAPFNEIDEEDITDPFDYLEYDPDDE